VTVERSGISAITESLSVEIKRHKFGAALAFILVTLVLALGGFGIYKLLHRENTVAHFWDISLAPLTNSGNAIDAMISPDGKYVVYVLSDRSAQSLWIRQVSAANDRMIVPAAPVGYFGLTFSPDGTDLYYVIKQNLDAGTLYRIPVLGGTPPVKLLEKIDGPVTFSPDGKQFAFVRGNYPKPGNSALVIANIDGTGSRDLVVKNFPERFSPIFFTGPSWAPDGQSIAASVATLGGATKILGFSVADGTEQNLSQQSWSFAGRVAWLPDMTGLIVVAGESTGLAQLWLVNHPEGTVRRITNDLGTYRTIGLTQDGKKFTTVQAQGLVNLWVVPSNDASKAERLPTGNVSFYSSAGNNVTWTPDDRIVFVSTEGGNPHIWMIKPDGSERKQLTANDGMNFAPTVSPDGKYIVYTVVRGGRKNLWRMNLDGSNPVQLTSGVSESSPSITPDSRWVIFVAPSDAKPTLWKVSIDGGTPTQITDHVVTMGVVSPDGKLIAFSYPESVDPSAPPNRIAIMPFEGGPLQKTFSITASGTVTPILRWSNDSKSVLFSVNANNVSNIWSQSLDGGPPKQVTDFKEMLITGFSWSRDGKQLAATRGNLLRDAVLIRDTK
jgi:Tol biopolymer transport system component